MQASFKPQASFYGPGEEKGKWEWGGNDGAEAGTEPQNPNFGIPTLFAT